LDKIITFLGSVTLGYLTTSTLFPPPPRVYPGVSIPLHKVQFTGADGSVQKAGTLGIQFAIRNPSDRQEHTFTGLLDSGSSIPVISSKIAERVGVKLYPATADPIPGAPPTAKVFHVPLEIVGLNGAFPTVISIVPDYYPVLIPLRLFTKYYNMILSSTDIMFTQKHPIWDGISITRGEHGEPIIDVNVGGINVPMNADTGSEEGSLSNMTAAMLGINRFRKINTEKMTKSRITKTITNFSDNKGNYAGQKGFATHVLSFALQHVLR
jgi:hypothetical protein